MIHPRAGGYFREAGDSFPRTEGSRDASPLCAAARSKVFESLVREGIQAPRGNVLVNLAVPCCRVEFRKPIPERREIGFGQA